MIKVYSSEDTKKFIKKIPYGYEFNYKNCKAQGVDLYNDTHKLISKQFVEDILKQINEKFPLNWADLEIFCLPFIYMQWTKDSGFTGREYLGRAWNNVYVLGAVRKNKPDYFISFLPEGKEGNNSLKIKNGIIQVDNVYGTPFKIDLIPKSNTTSRPQYYMKPEYITIHNTGNKNADAKANSEYVDKTANYVSWHFTVDDKVIIQELPINENGWHAGDGKDGTGNRKSIGIEICEYEGIDWEKAKNNACKLIKFLIKNVKTLKGIDCIVPHQHWSGKYCPHKILDEGWDKFIERVKKYMNSKYIGYEIVEEVPIVLDGKELDIKAPMIETSEGGHTFLPIRAFLETLRDEWGLDISVGWDGRVLLNKKKE